MELGLKQVAETFGVSEIKIIKWINNENLPADLVADQYRFHRADLIEWAAIHGHPFSPSIYAQGNGDLTAAGTHLTEALEAGGVLENVGGSDLRTILDTALAGLPLPPTMGHDALLELFLSRESLGSTAPGGGIAIPHPREPTLLAVPGAVMRLCYLSKPLDMAAADGVPVDKLFLIICPTAHEHLQLLARLGALLQVNDVREALRNKFTGDALFSVLREAGRNFHEPAIVTGEASV